MIRASLAEGNRVHIWCPACNKAHGLHVGLDGWTFNDDLERPTFTPSLKATYRHPTGYSNDNPAPLGYDGPYSDEVCHSFITDGRIQFLTDSTHSLAGQTVDLPEWPYSKES